LNDVKSSLVLFLHHCDGLQQKLGPILFQLPPAWELNMERFEKFLKQLPKGFRFAFEFRNKTWYTKEVYALLKKYKCAFCIYQLAGHMSPIEVTTDWVYIRLHGPAKNKYQGSYDFDTLQMWAERSKEWQKKGKDVFIYFDNDDSGYAAFNAQDIELMTNKKKPITRHEGKVKDLLMEAMRDKKMIELEYESSRGKLVRKVEPYLIGIKDKGKGNIFLTGYQYPTEGSENKNNDQAQFLLANIGLQKLRVLDEHFDDLKIDAAKIFGELPSIRTVYRIAPPKKKKRT